MAAVPAATESRPTYKQAVDEFRKQFLTEALHRHGGNRTYAAAELGMTRTALLELINRYDVRVPPEPKEVREARDRQRRIDERRRRLLVSR